MPELKKARVRHAKARDVGLFRKLWKAYIEEQHKDGSPVLPTDANVEFFVDVFKMYVDKEADGVVLFIGEVAVMLWGDSGEELETTLGRTAYAWGVYVTPDQRGKGLSDKLHAEALVQMEKFGYDAVVTGLLDENPHGAAAFERGTKREVHPFTSRTVYIKVDK